MGVLEVWDNDTYVLKKVDYSLNVLYVRSYTTEIVILRGI